MSDLAHGRIGLRLALAFVSVTLVGICLAAVLALLLSEHDISVLEQQRRTDLTRALTIDAASTFNTGNPGWTDVDLKPALSLARDSGTEIAVLDRQGNVVASSLVQPGDTAGLISNPITVDGSKIGTLLIKFSPRGLTAAVDNLKGSIAGAVFGAAGVAAVVALIVALLVARQITRPVSVLIASARTRRDGDRQARVGAIIGAPAELAELAVTFDEMADAVEIQERLRRDLVADVAHELRTPIAVMQAQCEALLDGVIAPTPDQIASLHEEVVRLGGIVADLQALAEAKAAAVTLHIVPCDLGEIAAVAADAWEARFAAAKLAFDRQLCPAPINADPGRIHQVLNNLLDNAVKFTPPGGRVKVELHCDEHSVHLEISDTGIGIAAAEHEHLFERMWRGANAEHATGTGIGLAVAAELIRAHQGTIRVASEPGHGTKFSIELPLAA